MDEKFIFGMLLGVVAGSLVCVNSIKARQLIKKGQQKVQSSVNKISKKSKQSS